MATTYFQLQIFKRATTSEKRNIGHTRKIGCIFIRLNEMKIFMKLNLLSLPKFEERLMNHPIYRNDTNPIIIQSNTKIV